MRRSRPRRRERDRDDEYEDVITDSLYRACEQFRKAYNKPVDLNDSKRTYFHTIVSLYLIRRRQGDRLPKPPRLGRDPYTVQDEWVMEWIAKLQREIERRNQRGLGWS